MRTGKLFTPWHTRIPDVPSAAISLDGSHPLLGDQLRFEVVNLNAVQVPAPLATSSFYGDHVVRLLLNDVSPTDWGVTFVRFCSLHDEAVKLDAMFLLFQLAGLRGMRDTIETELRRTSMYNALMETPLTQRAAHRVAKGEIIDSLNRSLKRNHQGKFDADELERLTDQVSLEDLRRVQDAAMDGEQIRDVLNNLQSAFKLNGSLHGNGSCLGRCDEPLQWRHFSVRLDVAQMPDEHIGIASEFPQWHTSQSASTWSQPSMFKLTP